MLMRYMPFTEEQIEIAKKLCLGATIYCNYHLRNAVHRNQFKDSHQALVCFVQNYAYERQGAAAAYPVIAEKSIEKVLSNRIGLIDLNDAKRVWKIYKETAKNEFNNLKINATHNPLNSDNGILTTMANEQIKNLAVYVRDMIQNSNTRKVHKLLVNVRGIGTKITSFYMRDIVYLGGLDELKIKDAHYLQPIDTWLEQTLSIILEDVPKKLEEKQRTIVELCKEADVSQIAFNQGAWVLGSQIAGNFSSFREILKGRNAKSIIQKRIKEREEYLSEMRRLLRNWPD